jgi:thiol-disulfide isomerase/thioredoxin
LDARRDASKVGLRIDFDIDMYSIACHNLQVAVIDPLDGLQVKSLQRDFKLRTVDFVKERQKHILDGRTDKGVHKHVGKTEEEEEAEEAKKNLEQEDGKAELDADWATSHDGFKHNHFDHVVQYHDFTIINFFAEWCSHCRQFSPTWNDIAKAVNEKEYTDADGGKRVVKALKMNCVDFKQECRNQGINAFPSIRVYRSDGRFASYEERRSQKGVLAWIDAAVKKTHLSEISGFVKHHNEIQHGCNVVGHMLVPRTPGIFELFAGGGEHALDPTMTNVSHFVRKLSFHDPRYIPSAIMEWISGFGMNYKHRRHMKPLDAKKFITEEFHQTYEHHLTVVSTMTSSFQFYQFSHYDRISTTTNKSEVPQARFNFDIDTFAIRILDSDGSFYGFATNLMGVLGGVFVVTKLFAGASHSVAKAAATSARPSGGSRKAMNTFAEG